MLACYCVRLGIESPPRPSDDTPRASTMRDAEPNCVLQPLQVNVFEEEVMSSDDTLEHAVSILNKIRVRRC